MNKMLTIVFKSESDAHKGLDGLKDLHQKGDITLYASAVLTKDSDGAIDIKQEADQGPIGTTLGLLTGSLIGLIGGPVGVAVGASAGSLGGLVYDSFNAGVNVDYLDEVSKVIAPGRAVVVAEIDEDWITPVDTKITGLGGQIFRRQRSEFIEDQLANESEALSREMEELEEELKLSAEENKAAMKKTLESIKAQLESNVAKADAKLEQVAKEAEAKTKALQEQMQKAREEKKAKIEKRITEIKVDQKVRSEKLQQARTLAIEALRP